MYFIREYRENFPTANNYGMSTAKSQTSVLSLAVPWIWSSSIIMFVTTIEDWHTTLTTHESQCLPYEELVRLPYYLNIGVHYL